MLTTRLFQRAAALGLLLGSALLAPIGAVQAQQVNMYCSFPDTAWCQAMANGFRKASGIPVNVTQKATGELYAQVRAERENPKGDVWWAGPGDAFVQAGQEGLLDEYRSPALGELHDWARKQAEITNYRSVGVYAGILTLGFNKELVAKKKLAVPKCWKDLLVPELKGEVQLSNPNSSGTSYMMLATLVQVMGEEEAFRYMKALHPSVSQYARSGTGPLKAVARGEAVVGVSVLHGVVNEVVNGFPVDVILPCEGTGYEIASMGLIKGSRNLEAARKFYDWALSNEAQKLQFEVKHYPIPSNKTVPLPPTVPKLSDIKLINYDFAKYGAAAERKRLLDRWDRDILGSK